MSPHGIWYKEFASGRAEDDVEDQATAMPLIRKETPLLREKSCRIEQSNPFADTEVP